MRVTMLGIATVIAALAAGDASAQGVNLTGRWRCVELCLGPPGSFAFITQNGWELNIVNDAGQPSRAWVDYPGRIWVENAQPGRDLFPGRRRRCNSTAARSGGARPNGEVELAPNTARQSSQI